MVVQIIIFAFILLIGLFLSMYSYVLDVKQSDNPNIVIPIMVFIVSIILLYLIIKPFN